MRSRGSASGWVIIWSGGHEEATSITLELAEAGIRSEVVLDEPLSAAAGQRMVDVRVAAADFGLAVDVVARTDHLVEGPDGFDDRPLGYRFWDLAVTRSVRDADHLVAELARAGIGSVMTEPDLSAGDHQTIRIEVERDDLKRAAAIVRKRRRKLGTVELDPHAASL